MKNKFEIYQVVKNLKLLKTSVIEIGGSPFALDREAFTGTP